MEMKKNKIVCDCDGWTIFEILFHRCPQSEDELKEKETIHLTKKHSNIATANNYYALYVNHDLSAMDFIGIRWHVHHSESNGNSWQDYCVTSYIAFWFFSSHARREPHTFSLDATGARSTLVVPELRTFDI